MGDSRNLRKTLLETLCRVRQGVLDKVVAGGAPQVAPEGRGLQGGDMAVQQDKEGTFG